MTNSNGNYTKNKDSQVVSIKPFIEARRDNTANIVKEKFEAIGFRTAYEFIESIPETGLLKPNTGLNQNSRVKRFVGRTFSEAREKAMSNITDEDVRAAHLTQVWQNLIYPDNRIQQDRLQAAWAAAKQAADAAINIENGTEKFEQLIRTDVQRDAAFLALLLSAHDMGLIKDNKYLLYAIERWEVWKSGDGVAFQVVSKNEDGAPARIYSYGKEGYCG